MIISKEKKREAEEITNSTNVIGKGTLLDGNIEAHGNVRIEGKVVGHVKSKSKVVLGIGGEIEGDILSQNADLEGEVRGRVEIVETLTIKAQAVVHGDIVASKLIVEPGAVFNGGCKMDGSVKNIKIGSETQRQSVLEEETSAYA